MNKVEPLNKEASKLISAMWNAMGLDTKKVSHHTHSTICDHPDLLYHERSEKLKDTYQAYVASPLHQGHLSRQDTFSPTQVCLNL